MKDSHNSDIKVILKRRHNNGGDFWATSDDRIYKGNPFSTIASLGMLCRFGLADSEELKPVIAYLFANSYEAGGW